LKYFLTEQIEREVSAMENLHEENNQQISADMTTTPGWQPYIISKGTIVGQKKIPLPQGETIIGRDLNCDIIIDTKYNMVSRRHGKIITQGREFYYIDLGSTNGSYFLSNNELRKVEPGTQVHLYHDVIIRLGGAKTQGKKKVCDLKFVEN